MMNGILLCNDKIIMVGLFWPSFCWNVGKCTYIGNQILDAREIVGQCAGIVLQGMQSRVDVTPRILYSRCLWPINNL